MRIPDVDYIRWAKTAPWAAIDLARSSVEPCPARLLGARRGQMTVSASAHDGLAPFVDALADRYRVARARVFTTSGGASFANWIACAVALEGARPGDEIIVERPTYQPLFRIAQAAGLRVRRIDRRFADRFTVDVEAFRQLVNRRTRLAIFTNLHNPSGARLSLKTLRALARALDAVGAQLLIDEVYLECVFDERTASCVHAGPNVLATNSLTKAYGLAGLRAGWILGPRELVQRAWRAQDLWANNNVTPAEQRRPQRSRRCLESAATPSDISSATAPKSIGFCAMSLVSQRTCHKAGPSCVSACRVTSTPTLWQRTC